VIVTVTLNPAIDKTLIVHAFKTGATNRATVDGVATGGKGINVARTLKRLGCDVLATGFLGADDRYSTAAMLAEQGIEADFVPVSGETRVNLKLIDTLEGVETEINEPGFEVPAEAISLFVVKFRALASKASVMVLSGSLPPGTSVDLYAELIAVAHAEGVQTLLDTAAPALAHGLAARPHLVKPNRAEAEELLGTAIADEDSLLSAADRILAMGARSVVISLGSDGAVSASSDGMWRAHPPAVIARSTVGAGDAMVAALAYGLMQSLPAPEALRLATATSCAAAITAKPYPSSREIQALLPQVLIEPVPLSRPWGAR
jgi:1-phosphofructokinase